MLHFGRDEGVEMVVAYHGVISTVRLQGKCAWDFLGEFFKNIFNGERVKDIDIFFRDKRDLSDVNKKYQDNSDFTLLKNFMNV